MASNHHINTQNNPFLTTAQQTRSSQERGAQPADLADIRPAPVPGTQAGTQ